ESVERMNGLLFIFRAVRTSGIERLRGWTGYRRRVFSFQIKALAERRDRRGYHTLRETFVIYVGHIVDSEPALAGRGVQIFAAKLSIEDIPGVMVSLLELAASAQMPAVVVRVGEPLKIASDDCRRFVVFGDCHSIEPLRAGCDINVAAHEIQQVRALKYNLRHPGIVVVTR